MLLSSYRDLICNLPYLDQAFETKRTIWQREYIKCQEFRNFCEKVFKTNTVTLSRRDLFMTAETDFQQGLFSINLWGYPRNMRGNSFLNILDSIPKIEKLLCANRELNEGEFINLGRKLNGASIGLSTLSKLLYFFKFTVEGRNCLIMDKRIIDVFNSKRFSELSATCEITEFNKTRNYLPYLKEIEEIAKANQYKADQLELFLFLFGKSLKGDF